MDRLTPFDFSEAMYDFRAVAEEDGRLSVVLAAVRADMLKPYLTALHEKHINLSRITVSIAGLAILCDLFLNGAPAVCLSVGDYGYEGCVLKNGVIHTSVYEELSGDDAETNTRRIWDEVKPLVSRLKSEEASPVIYLQASSRNVEPEGIFEMPVKMLDSDDVKKRLRIDCDEVLLAPLGGLLESVLSGTKGFNLAQRGPRPSRRLPVAVSVIIASLAILTIVPHILVPLEIEKRRLQQMEYQVNIRRDEIKKIEALKRELDLLKQEILRIKEFKESMPMAIKVTKELTSVVPKTAWLTRYRMTEGVLEIEGYAGSATEILSKLEESPWFQKAEFASPTVRDTRLNADRFVIKMEIEGYTKKKVEKGKDETRKK